MLTSYLQLSGTGLNSLPLAVTFPTLPSASCSRLRSVPDELLKILTPAGGQGCSPWLRGGVAPSLCPHHAHAGQHHPPGGLPCLPWRPSSKHPFHRKSPRGLRLRRGATPSASDLNPQPNYDNNLLCEFGQVPFLLSLWTMSGLDLMASQIPANADPL